MFVFSGDICAEVSFFWKVQTGKGDSFLLGSVYFLNKEHYPLRQAVEDSFAQCDTMMVAANPVGENQEKLTKLIIEIGMYKEGNTLKDDISGRTYQIVTEKLKELGLDIELYKKFKPWVVTAIFLQKGYERMGFDLHYSYEYYFFNKAKTAKKEIIELEGMECQVKSLANLSKDEIENILIYSILEIDKATKNKYDMMNVWISGNTDGLEKFLTEKRLQYPELIDMNNKFDGIQNKKIAKKIDGHLRKDKKLFVVLPAERMVGKNGIIQLLKNMGYNVSQL
jgi:uncharacterized protein